MPEKKECLSTRVAVIEEHIATINGELGEARDGINQCKSILTDPETGLCLKINTLNEKVNATNQKLGQYKWIFTSLIVPMVLLIVIEIVKKGVA